MNNLHYDLLTKVDDACIRQEDIIIGMLLFAVISFLVMIWLTYVKFRKTKAKRLPLPLKPIVDSSSSYQEIVRILRNQDFLVNFANYLNSSGNFTEKINKALHILGRYLLADRIYIFEDFEHGKMAHHTFRWCKENIEPETEKYRQLLYKPYLEEWKVQLVKDGIIHFSDMSALPDTLQKALHAKEINSLIILPLYVYNDFYGFLGLDNSASHSLDDMEIGFLKTISLMLSGAFERLFYIEEIKNSEKEARRQILSAIIQAEEKERGRLARDLHDGLGPLLSSIKLYAKVLGTTPDHEKRKELLHTTMEVINESMMLIKEISNNLSPHVLDDFGLASAIQSFCKKISLTKEIEIKFDSNVFDQRFETNLEMVLFRILKELVNNTMKHALATRIEIFLLRTENMLSLIYSDNGIGFDIKRVLDDKLSGMGISNMVNRISSINGRLMFDSQTGKGIQMKMEVELKTGANHKELP